MDESAPRTRRFLSVVWEITLQCNLACGHCGSRAGIARPRELSTEEALDIVRQLAELDVEKVTLIGGEAYLRPDWEVLARAIVDAGMICSVVSGGRGLDADVARRMKEAGLNKVAISIDGLEAAHDRQRGWKGSYQEAIGALGNLASAGVPTSVNTQINRLSSPDLEQLLDVLVPLGVHAWRVQLTVAMGRAADHPEILLQPYELLDLFPRLARLKARAIDAGIGFWPGNNIGYFGPYETLLRADVTDSGHWSGCTAGDRTLGIEADGSFKGCPSLPSSAYTGGNIRDRSLRDMVDHAPELRFTRERTVEDLWGHCRTCYYADVCRAGCTWTSHVLFGRPGNNPYCHYRALQLQKRGRRERLVRVQAPPGIPFDHGRFELVEEPIPEEVAHVAPVR